MLSVNIADAVRVACRVSCDFLRRPRKESKLSAATLRQTRERAAFYLARV